ncbi:uncharacterized protein LOC114539022 [Dendronephthya gigantea]|uniref:uncharacterized protein LOC114539022 n=1 Tax=Dendronephthya gigantea TaxID=151771 RepID=UPI001068F80D|nr:uncharacterized protein LOC114539022 [Dendronephthya gigantea]
MKLLNKTEKIAHLQGQSSTIAIQEMLTGFRSTPHPATGATPYEAMMNRLVRTKLDHQASSSDPKNSEDATINRKDGAYKEKMTRTAHKRNVKEHNFIVGDHVLLKQKKTNKWSTAYEPAIYIVTRVNGSSIAARRMKDGREVYRDASQYKLVNMLVRGNEHRGRTDEEEIISENERETLMKNFGENETEYQEHTESDASTNKGEETRNTPGMEIQQAETQQDDKPQLELPPPEKLQPLRRSTRNRKKPLHLTDYIT